MKLTLPGRPIIGFRPLSEISHVPPGTLRCAAHDRRLPLDRYQIGNQVVFDAVQVSAWLADGASLLREAPAYRESAPQVHVLAMDEVTS